MSNVPHFQSPEDVEAELIAALQDCRNNPQDDGTPWGMSDMEGYAKAIQTRILEPLIAQRVAAGMIGPIDDLGHDTAFVAAWNRAVAGKPGQWDHRELATVYLRAARDAVPGEVGDLMDAVMNGKMDGVDQALISHLPEIVFGSNPNAWRSPVIFSQYNDLPLKVRFDGLQPVLLNEDGSPLDAPDDLPAYVPLLGREVTNKIFGLIAFHHQSIDSDESTAAWEAWHAEIDRHGVGRRSERYSMMSWAVRNVTKIASMGISEQVLRQDEAVSIDIRDDGVMVYRGAVEGLKVLVDEGQFICGPWEAFADILTRGGFSPEAAESYLTRLAQTDHAFAASLPEGSDARIMIDAETLFAVDHDPDQMVHEDDVERAIVIYAAGTFPMPDMKGHRARAREADAEMPAPI